jgi:polysaccharide deacetylase family protein (PEP-CTERM system associated)
MKSVFTVDVEDWYHILDVPSTPPMSEWDSLPSRVEKNFRRLLELFDRTNIRATCFFLGWIGKQFPHLVKEASAAGHEIASHGNAHQLVTRITEAEFFRDITLAKRILEDVCGEPVIGYRAPGFSAPSQTPWFFSRIAEAGYEYDSSVFPVPHTHGEAIQSLYRPYTIETSCGIINEFPMSTVAVMGKRMYFFGGGYLRLTPLFVIERMARRVLKEGSPVICYIHPREIDPDHPRLPMSVPRRFRSYVNLAGTENKVQRLLSAIEFTSIRGLLQESCSELDITPLKMRVDYGCDHRRDLVRNAAVG